MPIEDLIAFNILLFLSMLSPGPAFLMIARQTLAEGFASGVKTGFGLGLVASFWTMTALIGLDRLFDLFPMIYSTAKAVGALALIYFAFTMWRGATDQIAEKPVIFKNQFFLACLQMRSILNRFYLHRRFFWLFFHKACQFLPTR